MSGQSGGFDDNPWITTERIQQPTGDAKEIEFVKSIVKIYNTFVQL